MQLVVLVVNDGEESTLKHAEIIERLDNREFKLRIDTSYILPHIPKSNDGSYPELSFNQLVQVYDT